MDNQGIPRDIAYDWSDYYKYMSPGTRDFCMDLFGKIIRGSGPKERIVEPESVDLKQLSDDPTKSDLEIVKDVVLAFYEKMGLRDKVEELLDGRNEHFAVVFFDPEDERYKNIEAPPCVTTTKESQIPNPPEQPNILCIPINGYNSEQPNLRPEDIFILAHELSHTVSFLYNEKEVDGKRVIPIPKEGDIPNYLFGETDSKTIELKMFQFLSETYPNADKIFNDAIRAFIFKSFVAGPETEARESFIRLGVGSLSPRDDSTPLEGFLDQNEMEIIARNTNMPPELLTERFNKMLAQGVFRGRDHMKYMMGAMLAIQMWDRDYKDVAAALKEFSTAKKRSSVEDVVKNLGIENVTPELLFEGYHKFIENFSKTVTMDKGVLENFAKDEKVAAQKEDARSALGRMHERIDKENNFEEIPQ
jgi:hypothetical protein